MKRTLSLAALSALLLAVPLAFGDSGEGKTASLMGVYTIVSGEEDGKPAPADHFRGSKVTITADSITATDRSRKEFFACAYKLDTSTRPWTISMTGPSPKKEKSVGIVEVEGNTLKLCYALPGADKPTAFKTREKQHLFVLEREKDLKSR